MDSYILFDLTKPVIILNYNSNAFYIEQMTK